jgi:transposase
MRRERAALSRHMLRRWGGFASFLADRRACLSNNAAERALRGIALGRRAWLFAGSDPGGDRAAFMYSLITTAKLNDVDPQAWLADVLGRIAGTPMSCLHEFLPWNWTPTATAQAA